MNENTAISNPTVDDLDGPVIPLKELERRGNQKALRATNGSVGKAAKLLGIGRATLYRRLAELELPPARSVRAAAAIGSLVVPTKIETADPREQIRRFRSLRSGRSQRPNSSVPE